MDFTQAISQLAAHLDEAGLRYAVIGGMAMALRGVHRATFDIDFLLMLEDLEAARKILSEQGYDCVFQSENVSHFQKSGGALARVDILHAFRGPSLSMLDRAERLPFDAASLPVVQIEDIIGLKLQAAINNAARAPGDWGDIYQLTIHSASLKRPMNWPLVEDYLNIFRVQSKLTELKELYERHL